MLCNITSQLHVSYQEKFICCYIYWSTYIANIYRRAPQHDPRSWYQNCMCRSVEVIRILNCVHLVTQLHNCHQMYSHYLDSVWCIVRSKAYQVVCSTLDHGLLAFFLLLCSRSGRNAASTLRVLRLTLCYILELDIIYQNNSISYML